MSTASAFTPFALPANHSRTNSGSRFPLILAIVAVGVAFLLVEHSFRASLRLNFQLTQDEMEDVAGGGNALRRLCFLGLAGLGMLSLVTPSRFHFGVRALPSLCILFYLGWCSFSVLWSIDPGMSLRRILVMWCCVMGATGIAKRFNLREWTVMCMVLSGLFMTYGVISEILLGSFRPWSGEYRFSGTLHPNQQGLLCSMLALSSFCLAKGETNKRRLLVIIMLCGLFFLVLTKSRTAFAGTILAMGLIWSLRTPLGFKLFVILSGVWFVSLTLFLVMVTGVDLADEVTQALLLGRDDEQVGSLTGRIPIWTELAPKIRQRFLLGYGFEAYWTPDHIEEMTEEVQWAVMEAHSSYIESMLSTGFIGTSLFVLGAFLGMTLAGVRFLSRRQSGYDFLFGLCAFGFVNAFTESGMTSQLMFTFLLGAGLMHLCFFAPGHFTTAPSATVPEHSRSGADSLGVIHV